MKNILGILVLITISGNIQAGYSNFGKNEYCNDYSMDIQNILDKKYNERVMVNSCQVEKEYGENNATKLFKIFIESEKIKQSYIMFKCNPEKCKIK